MDLTISENLLALVDPDGVVHVTKYPQLFNTSRGYIEFSDNVRTELLSIYGTEAAALAKAVEVADAYSLPHPTSFDALCEGVAMLAYMSCLT